MVHLYRTFYPTDSNNPVENILDILDDPLNPILDIVLYLTTNGLLSGALLVLQFNVDGTRSVSWQKLAPTQAEYDLINYYKGYMNFKGDGPGNASHIHRGTS